MVSAHAGISFAPCVACIYLVHIILVVNSNITSDRASQPGTGISEDYILYSSP